MPIPAWDRPGGHPSKGAISGCLFAGSRRFSRKNRSDLRDLVWLPVRFVWSNGGEAAGHIPTRYPNTLASNDGPLRLARKTEWAEHEGAYSVGLGQRVLATDQAEYPLLDCRVIELSPADNQGAHFPAMAELIPREKLQPCLLIA